MFFKRKTAVSEKEKLFDLNIKKILDNWDVYNAVREIIANALDEQVLSKTKRIEIYKDDKQLWHIRDFGRGIKYTDLTQNENSEKRKSSAVIGKFGVGLKDALAVLYKFNIFVKIRSKYGVITLKMSPKAGFPDVETLHAAVSAPDDSNMQGTDFIIAVKDVDIDKAKSLFLVFSERIPLDTNEYGEIYQKPERNAYIYVHGVKVAEEPNYLFDYNITKVNKALDKALNRERTAVGRTAYSGIVKSMLMKSNAAPVIKALTDDLQKIHYGTNHDETNLKDIQVHAVKEYNASHDIVAMSAEEAYDLSNDDKEKIKESGREVVMLPGQTFAAISNNEHDYTGKPIGTFQTVLEEYNQSFEYHWVREEKLNEKERKVLSLKEFVFKVYQNEQYKGRIRISENINTVINGDTFGCFDPKLDVIVIKRSVLSNPEKFCEVLFHESVHAKTGQSDNSRDFENSLGGIIGKLALMNIRNDNSIYVK